MCCVVLLARAVAGRRGSQGLDVWRPLRAPSLLFRRAVVAARLSRSETSALGSGLVGARAFFPTRTLPSLAPSPTRTPMTATLQRRAAAVVPPTSPITVTIPTASYRPRPAPASSPRGARRPPARPATRSPGRRRRLVCSGGRSRRSRDARRRPEILTASSRSRRRLCGNRPVCSGTIFFTKSFLGDNTAVLAPSSDEEPTSPRHRGSVA